IKGTDGEEYEVIKSIDPVSGVKVIKVKKVDKKTVYQFEDGTQAPISDVDGSYETRKNGDVIKGTDGNDYIVIKSIDPVSGVKVIKVMKAVMMWVDEEGNPLTPNADGIILGYEFVKTLPADENGIIRHIYKKEAEDCDKLLKALKDTEFAQLITPNGDAKNEEWKLPELKEYSEHCVEGCVRNRVRIFNRWGAMVYNKKNYMLDGDLFKGYSTNSLDLQDGEKLPAGTYFYIVEAGDGFEKTGYIYVVY
ncbi:MAG: gliding motility-associated C-terminal domain-containing protein, partial [Flavobacteriaceae bacterium]|nr:gliding motility-associated C-terminal domain-containing protein [Flavobacteriaceae bacterium]